MSRKYLIHYPNGMKRHVDRAELTELSPKLQQISAKEYRSSSLPKELEAIQTPRFYQGKFVTVYSDGRKATERMESVRGMIERLSNSGQIEAAT